MIDERIKIAYQNKHMYTNFNEERIDITTKLPHILFGRLI